MSSNLKIEKVCEWCGSQFVARTTATAYCSHRCSSLAYKERKRQAKLQQFKDEYARTQTKPRKDVEDVEFMTPIELSRLLGMSRASIYNYITSGVIKKLRLRGKTLIRKKDVEELFETPPTIDAYIPCRTQRNPISDFYTSKEVQDKYGISNSALYEIAHREKWPKTQSRGKTLWSKEHVNRYFTKKKPSEDITEWYTAAEIQEKFGMTLSAIYNVVSKEGIPKKKEKGATFYSKLHFDKAKGIEVDDSPKYYTYAEAMEKFGLTRDQLHHYLKYHNIPRTKKGKFTYISRKELDDLLAPPSI